MDLNRTEDEQIEALKKWWAANGTSIIAGVVIGLGAIFGWRGWQTHLVAQAEAASVLYTNMITEVRQNKEEEAAALGNRLLNDYSRTSYAAFAGLILAKIEVDKGNLDAAAKQLQWVLDNADLDEIKRLARLRLARVELDRGNAEESLSLLNKSKSDQLQASYDELRGDVYLQQGKREEALTAYQSALASANRPGSENSFLQLKIDDIGRQKP